jgi:hypothetical protein
LQLIRIRYYQIRNDLGFLFFVIAALIAALSYFFFDNTDNKPYYILAIVLFALLRFHTTRKDFTYVLKHLDHPIRQLTIEYQLFLLPFSIPSLFTRTWYFFFIIHAAGFLMPFVKLKASSVILFPKISTYIPPAQFEWISGIRKNGVGILIFLLIALVLSSVKLFPLAALCLINLSIMGFYTEGESRQMLTANNYSPQEIMLSKIRFSLKIMLLINLPVLLINSVFNPDFIFINGMFLLYSGLVMVFAVACKYNAYKPDTNLDSISIQFAFAFMVVIYPQFIILTFLLTTYYYRQAIKNLSRYTNDHT